MLPFEVASGAENMAADEVLLLDAADGQAALRFYGWSEPTLSLGYFQPTASRTTDPLLAQLPFVRRATGGAALVHHHEVTYALALPAGRPWQTRTSWLCRMHRIIAVALERLNVIGAELFGDGESTGRDEVLCFRHFTAGDVLLADCKVVGSAQRKMRGALLQHGAVLLRRSPHAPSIPGIHERSGTLLRPEDVGREIVQALLDETGWEPASGSLSESERTRIARLADEKYATNAWNDRR